jgi:osomolarity two-component system sensor histidine kinase NIK1
LLEEKYIIFNVLKILLIEDNLLNQKVVIFYLQKLNGDITAVDNGIDALEIIKKETFDLILMDIMLPEKNGYEITVEIRKLEKENKIENPVPIIALTANTYDNDRDKCLAAGMNEYLEKPFSAQQLIEMIQKFV